MLKWLDHLLEWGIVSTKDAIINKIVHIIPSLICLVPQLSHRFKLLNDYRTCKFYPLFIFIIWTGRNHYKQRKEEIKTFYNKHFAEIEIKLKLTTVTNFDIINQNITKNALTTSGLIYTNVIQHWRN